MNFIKLTSKSDTIGTAAGTLCLLHCMATPFLFVVQASVVAHHAHPWWWGLLDVFFIVISFFAVWWSAKTTTKSWMRIAFWGTWLFLAFFVANEEFHLLHVPETLIYIPALVLIGLHLYNHKYCNC